MRAVRKQPVKNWKRITPEPLLDCNRKPYSELKTLIDREGILSVQRILGISQKTLYRWVTGRYQIPGHQQTHIRIWLGEYPGTDGQWSGWIFRQGKLWSPENVSFTQGQLRASLYDADRITSLQRQVQALQVRLASAENALDAYAPAANDRKRA